MKTLVLRALHAMPTFKQRPKQLVMAVVSAVVAGVCSAQTQTSVNEGSTQSAGAQRAQVNAGSTQDVNIEGGLPLTELDRKLAKLWSISDEEMSRALLLAKGPRGSFSVPNLSPLETLGIHARSDEELRRYAEKFARLRRRDVAQSLVWNTAVAEANKKLPQGPMLVFDKPNAIDPSMARALSLPQMWNIPTGRSPLAGAAK
jgi:hypothetical protein